MGTSITSKFNPRIEKYVEALTEGRIGLCAATVRLTDVASGCSTLEQGPCCDRFKVVLPYAGHSLQWEVIFNSYYPDEAPDIIFLDDPCFLPDIFKLVSLRDWDPDDCKSLLYVIEELYDLYKSYQTSLIQTHHRLEFELAMITSSLGKEAVEIHVTRRANKIGPIKYLIKLVVDFQQIPTYLTKDSPGEDSAVLLVTFHTPEGNRVTPQLFLSPSVERALGGSAGLRIPHYPGDSCMEDYIPTITHLLNDKVQEIVETFTKRREYIEAFISVYGRSVLEYDTESFSKITFLLELYSFYFLLSVDIPRTFPKEQPSLQFQSIYHEQNGEPYNKVVKGYPYSPRWSADTMAKRMREYLIDSVTEFQQLSIKEGSAT